MPRAPTSAKMQFSQTGSRVSTKLLYDMDASIQSQINPHVKNEQTKYDPFSKVPSEFTYKHDLDNGGALGYLASCGWTEPL